MKHVIKVSKDVVRYSRGNRSRHIYDIYKVSVDGIELDFTGFVYSVGGIYKMRYKFNTCIRKHPDYPAIRAEIKKQIEEMYNILPQTIRLRHE